MSWSQRADRKVVEAVIAVFSDTPTHSRHVLSSLHAHRWERSYYWLDASGMALYFLARVESLGIADALPAATLARFRQNLADSRVRSEYMFSEFRALNEAFQEAGLTYCNEKGFTLVPDSCPDPVLRCQLDFDFLVDGKDLALFRGVLEKRGYKLHREIRIEQEYKTESAELPKISGYYKPRKQRCVELHFIRDEAGAAGRDERLSELVWQSMQGLSFPAFSPVEQLIGQATHLFEHLCNPGTRPAWVLEFVHHVRAHRGDETFWQQVRERTLLYPGAAMALGVAFLLANDLFGEDVPEELETWMTGQVPENVTLWVERYGRRAVLAGSPGTKLYLLLRDQLHADDEAWKQKRRAILLPMHPAPRLMQLPADAMWWEKVRAEYYQVCYTLFRIRFHIVQGLVYRLEASRWRRTFSPQQPTTRPETGQTSLSSSSPHA